MVSYSQLIRGLYKIVIVLPVLTMALNVYGSTWHVESSGTGDFTIIQDAVEAAADGDTIMIGPGRYDDWVDVHAPAWTFPAVVWVTKDDLVFIGSGQELTQVGPEEYFCPPSSMPMVFCCIDNFRFTIRDLTVENCYDGIYAYGRLEVMNCSVINCEAGIAGFTENGMFVDSTTIGSESYTSIGIVTYSPADSAVITNCEFIGNGQGVSFSGTTGVLVENCEFTCGRSALKFNSSDGSVHGCFTDQNDGSGLIARNEAEVEIVDCEFYGSIYGLTANSGSVVRAENTIFRGGPQHSTVHLTAAAQVYVNGCHILNGGGLSVKHEFYLAQYGSFVQDLTENYWGTTNTEQIDAWIWDHNDDSSINSVVDYLPIADGPISTEDKSFGSIKAMFR